MFSSMDNNRLFKPSPQSNRISVVSPSRLKQIINPTPLYTHSRKTCMAYIPVTLAAHLSPHITIPQWRRTWRTSARQGDRHPPAKVRDEIARFQFLALFHPTTIATGRQLIAKRRHRHL